VRPPGTRGAPCASPPLTLPLDRRRGGRDGTGRAPAVAQSVKEVLDSLLADSIVDTDKIGTSVLYWAFPSKASQLVRRRSRRPRTWTPPCPAAHRVPGAPAARARTHACTQRKRKIQELAEQATGERARIKQLKKESEDAQKGREDSVRPAAAATAGGRPPPGPA